MTRPCLIREHTTRPCMTHPCRYPDILAYDHTRVKLSPAFHKEDGDYINANFIYGNDAKVPMYIAAQGESQSEV